MIMRKFKKMSREEFVEAAKTVHGEKYDYGWLKDSFYKSMLIPIECKKHKEVFLQVGGDHLYGYGCKRCGVEAAKETRKKKLEAIKQNPENGQQATAKEMQLEMEKLANSLREVGEQLARLGQKNSSNIEENRGETAT